MSLLRQGSQPVSVGLVSSPSTFIAFEFMRDFLDRCDPLDLRLVHISHDELEIVLAENRFDFGFSDRPSRFERVSSRRIFSSEIRFFVDRKLARQPLRQLLSELPLLLCDSETSNRRLIEYATRVVGVVPRSIVTSEYPAMAYALCQAGEGVGLFTEAAVRQLPYRLQAVGEHASRAALVDELYFLHRPDRAAQPALARALALLPEFGCDITPA